MRSVTLVHRLPTNRTLWRVAGVAAALLVTACSGGDGAAGTTCASSNECIDSLQCLNNHCVARCVRGPDCGDGYACAEDGQCIAGGGQLGDRCASETACTAGLACRLDDADPDGDGVLAASCGPDLPTGPAGASCDSDDACRTGSCALGRCIDVCEVDRDCGVGYLCTSVPRTSIVGSPSFSGCVPARGSITWEIPIASPSANFDLPVPGNARSVVLDMSIDGPGQTVGATSVLNPRGTRWYTTPLTDTDYYTNRVRHTPTAVHAVLGLPGSPDLDFVPGAYPISVSSFRFLGVPGTATPTVWATAKLDDGVALDLHFYFLDLGEHPCRAAFGVDALNATSARLPPFHDQYLPAVRALFANYGIDVDLNDMTFTDLPNHPDLDSLTINELPRLLELGGSDGGVNVFMVRTMFPVGTAALVDSTPGTPVDVGAGPGGVAIAVDALCYRSYQQLARTTAHAIAQHLGLARNREPRGQLDPINDSDPGAANLMFYSDLGGSELSPGQRSVLRTSPVLR